MSTLAEIEAALPRLNAEKLEQLEAKLWAFRTEHFSASDLSEFAGSLQVAEEPLVFQRRMREEWG